MSFGSVRLATPNPGKQQIVSHKGWGRLGPEVSREVKSSQSPSISTQTVGEW